MLGKTTKIYESHYGHPGETHSLRPIYEVRGNDVFATRFHESGHSALPWFQIRGDKMVNTIHHPDGAQSNAWYQIRGNNIHTTTSHPEGATPLPVFKMKQD